MVQTRMQVKGMFYLSSVMESSDELGKRYLSGRMAFLEFSGPFA